MRIYAIKSYNNQRILKIVPFILAEMVSELYVIKSFSKDGNHPATSAIFVPSLIPVTAFDVFRSSFWQTCLFCLICPICQNIDTQTIYVNCSIIRTLDKGYTYKQDHKTDQSQ